MRTLTLVIALSILAGCGPDDADRDTVGKEIADDYNRAMDEAAAVEDQLREQQERRERAIEEPQ